MSVIEALNAARPFVQQALNSAITPDYREECQHRLDLIDRALAVSANSVEETSRVSTLNAISDCLTLNEVNALPLYIAVEALKRAKDLITAIGAAFQPTHRHVKSGRLERVIGEAEAQVSTGRLCVEVGPKNSKHWHIRDIKDGDRLVVYQGANGKLWVRFRDEFTDSRFVEIGTEEQS